MPVCMVEFEIPGSLGHIQILDLSYQFGAHLKGDTFAVLD